MVIRYGKETTVWIARVVDESSRSAHIHTIAHVCSAIGAFFCAELVEVEEVIFVIGSTAGAAVVTFFFGDDFTAVGVDELACFKVFEGPETW